MQHDVTLTGKSGATHQIDVFWTFDIAGQQYQTCIECKHYGTAVKKSHVAAFAGVLADIGNANGIFVTTMGYQKGAKLLAKQTNIRLILLNPTIQAFEITGILAIPRMTNFVMQFDREACLPLMAAAGLKDFKVQARGRDAVLRNAMGQLLDLGEALKGQLKVAGPTRADFSGLSIETEIGWLPLTGATFDLEFDEIRETFTVTANDAVQAILEDVLANTKAYVDDKGRLKPAPKPKAKARRR